MASLGVWSIRPGSRACVSAALYLFLLLFSGARDSRCSRLTGNRGTQQPAAAAAARVPCASLALSRVVGAEDPALETFASRLALGQLQRRGDTIFVYRQQPAAAPAAAAAGSSREALARIAECLSVCPVFCVCNSRGQLVPVSYPAADTSALPPLAAEEETAAAASAPAHAALALGLFFLSPRDAAEYAAHVAGDSRSPLQLRRLPLARAFPTLRYVHPSSRREAADAMCPSVSKGPRLLRTLKNWLAGRPAGETAAGSRLRCLLVPDTEILSKQIVTHEQFLGTPVFELQHIHVRPGSALHKALQQQQRQQQPQVPRQQQGPSSGCYVLRARPTTARADRWQLLVAFEGVERHPIFCRDSDALEAFAAFKARLLPAAAALQLPAAASLIRVRNLETVLDELSLPAAAEGLQPPPLLLPDLRCLDTAEASPL